MKVLWSNPTRRLIDAALEEDLGDVGDITSALMADADGVVRADLVARQDGVICGLFLAEEVCAVFAAHLGRSLTFASANAGNREFLDGDAVGGEQVVGCVAGPRSAVLAVERTLLNFLARMSGVATLTDRYVAVAKAANPTVHVLDTRKTIPGWRELDKYAVCAGGGYCHRMGLYDAILIKDNHLAGIPTDKLAEALERMLARRPAAARFVEVEVDRLEQLERVLDVSGIDIVLLDNFSIADLTVAVEMRNARGLREKVALEASGGVTLETIGRIAAGGVERISAGALTHSAATLDLTLDFG